MAKFIKISLPQSAASDQYFRLLFFFWALPLLFTFIYCLVNFAGLPDQIPLFYSRSWGEAQLASRFLIFLPFGGTLLLGIFNLSLATSFHAGEKIFAYLLAGTAVLVSILSAITTINIINLMK